MDTGAWVALVAVVVALAFGVYRALSDGRFRGSKPIAASAQSLVADGAGASETVPALSLLADTPWVGQAGERATLLQFSSAFCAPCRATRRILTEVAAAHPDVAHIEVDAEQHLDVVRRLGILRTPTTVVLDAAGRERGRATGAPRREQVEASLAGIG